MGHRAWLRAGAEPAYPFGHGLGYTSWEVTDLTVKGDVLDGTAQAHVRVRNTGDRPGKAVVQLYLEPPADALGGATANRLFD